MLIYNDITCFVFDVICCGFHVKNFRFLLNAQKSKYKYQARHFFFTEMTLARMIYFDAVFDIDVRSVKYGRTPLLPLPPPSPDAR